MLSDVNICSKYLLLAYDPAADVHKFLANLDVTFTTHQQMTEKDRKTSEKKDF